MPDQTKADLSKYRLQKASEALVSAKREFDAGDYATANNRAYYCVFHLMRAVLALDGEDYKKHSAVIARFTQNYLKTEILPRDYSKLIFNVMLHFSYLLMRQGEELIVFVLLLFQCFKIL